jgi:maltose/moltooligosaccharide transporter
MEPFRAFVGDQLSPAQRPRGYAMQSFFIGVGAVVASMLPWILARFGVSNSAADAAGVALVPDTVRYAFDLGAMVLLGAVLWTVLRAREYPPAQLSAFSDATPATTAVAPVATAGDGTGAVGNGRRTSGLLWSAIGVAAAVLIRLWHLDQQLFLLCGGALLWGVLQLVYGDGGRSGLLSTIMGDLHAMPDAMRRLVPVQFFSWLALFAMWIYTTPAVAQVHFGSTDAGSDAYNQGANWVGVLFAAYNGFAALAAIIIPFMVRRWGMRWTHLINLLLGGLALLSFHWIRDASWLLLSMLGIGFAWASILSLPYALLSDSVPAQKMGLYMGIFNFFIVIPQLVAASVLGVLLKWWFGGAPIYALLLGAASFASAAVLVLRVRVVSHTSVAP